MGLPASPERKTMWRLFVLLCVVVQLAGAAPDPRGQVAASRQVDDNCRHRKFKECNCDQFAVILDRTQAAEYMKYGVKPVHERGDLPRGSKRPFYICQMCQKCGDGVREERQCTPKSDTECSVDKCADETWVFNFGLKACQPPPPPPTTTTTITPSSTVGSKVTGKETASVAAGQTRDVSNVGSPLWLQNNSLGIILALIGGVVILFLVVVSLVVLVLRIRRQADGLLPSGTPSSSQSSSRESVAPTHV